MGAWAVLMVITNPQGGSGQNDPRGVSAQDAIDQGLVRPGGQTAPILKEIEAEFAKNPPRTSVAALEVVERATARLGQSPGVPANLQPVVAGQDACLLNAGGVTTTLKANGEIIVERGGNIILHLIP